MLRKLMVMLGIEPEDTERLELLGLLIESAASYVLNQTRRKELIPELESTVVNLAVVMYNRRGTEGEQGRTESGISHTFYVLGKDVPESITADIKRYTIPKKVGVIY